jgi:hypothetical protein
MPDLQDKGPSKPDWQSEEPSGPEWRVEAPTKPHFPLWETTAKEPSLPGTSKQQPSGSYPVSAVHHATVPQLPPVLSDKRLKKLQKNSQKLVEFAETRKLLYAEKGVIVKPMVDGRSLIRMSDNQLVFFNNHAVVRPPLAAVSKKEKMSKQLTTDTKVFFNARCQF